MSKKVVQDVIRSLTPGGRGDVLCAAQPCWLLLPSAGGPLGRDGGSSTLPFSFLKHLYFRGKGWSDYA